MHYLSNCICICCYCLCIVLENKLQHVHNVHRRDSIEINSNTTSKPSSITKIAVNTLPQGNTKLARKASFIVVVGFVPGFIALYLMCRFLPDLISKIGKDP